MEDRIPARLNFCRKFCHILKLSAYVHELFENMTEIFCKCQLQGKTDPGSIKSSQNKGDNNFFFFFFLIFIIYNKNLFKKRNIIIIYEYNYS